VGLFRKEDSLEGRLRQTFTPRSEFTGELTGRVLATARNKRYARASRSSFATAVAVFMLGTFASFGGVGLAAAGAHQTVRAVSHLTVAQKPVIHRQTAASDEYGNAAAPKVKPKVKHAVKPAIAVKGVSAARTTPTVKTQGSLPFTGLSLLATALGSLAFIGMGVAFRRAGAKA